jgi:hypothetical protein
MSERVLRSLTAVNIAAWPLAYYCPFETFERCLNVLQELQKSLLVPCYLHFVTPEYSCAHTISNSVLRPHHSSGG